MTDKEMLELAAKAAGIDVVWNEQCGGFIGQPDFPISRDWVKFDPLTDDGDALRLAVKLKLTIGCPGVVRDDDGRIQFVSEETDPNDYAATRRAIVRSAAEIGRNMP